jgi:beta-N-acetylhexosaminidase
MGYSLHWAISRDDARSGNVAEAAPDSGGQPQTALRTKAGAPGLRAARHFFVAVNGLWITPETRELMAETQPGGVVLRAENIQSPAQVLQLVRDLKEAAGSTTQRLSDFPIVMLSDPADAARSLAWDTGMATSFAGAFPDAQLAAQSAQDLARACAEMGVSVVFGPTLAQQTTSLNRDFGNDALTGRPLSAAASAYTKGMVDGGVLPIVKYFPRGAETTAFSAANGGVSQLAEAMLPFEEAVAQGTPGILVGHSPVPELDPGHPDRPASQSQLMVTDLLRGRWGFNGVVIADDITRRAATGNRSVEQTAVESFIAGCDAVVFLDPSPARVRSACAAVESAAASGLIDPRALEHSARRIEVWQTWLDRPLPAPMAAAPQPAHSMLARTYEPPVQDAPMPQPRRATPPQEHVASTPELNDWVEPVASAPVELATPPPEPVEYEPAEETPPQPEPAAEAAAQDHAPDNQAPDDHASIEAASTEASVTAETSESTLAETPAETDPENDATPQEEPAEMLVASPPPDEADDAPALIPESEPNGTAEETPEVVRAPDVQPEEATPESAPTVTESPVEIAIPETDAAEITHVVAKGDTLSGVAAKYDVTMDDIMRWNKLEKQQINLGAKLIVYRGAPPVLDASNDELEIPVEAKTPQPVSVASEEAVEPPADSAQTPEPAESYGTHEIKPGDTLTRIARMYGVTQDELLKLNGLNNPNQILIGQKLRVPR